MIFLRLANKGGLHPYDWQRFYGFIATCHRFSVQLAVTDLAQLLRSQGFQDAGYISEVYEHGREILSQRHQIGPYGWSPYESAEVTEARERRLNEGW